jgi:transposase
MAASTTLPHRKVVQAKALLWAAQGLANQEIARRCEVDSDTVRRWRARFADQGADGVGVIAKGRGRKPALPEGTVAEIVRVTCHEAPDDTSTHWTTRSLAKRFGIGKDAIARVWADHNLKPWRVDNFKLSNDPDFEENRRIDTTVEVGRPASASANGLEVGQPRSPRRPARLEPRLR